MADVIRWEEPPPRRHGQVHDWAAIGEKLRSKPNEWAVVAVCLNQATAGSTARYVREGKYQKLGPGFDAVARTVNGEARVYARYVGGDDRA